MLSQTVSAQDAVIRIQLKNDFDSSLVTDAKLSINKTHTQIADSVGYYSLQVASGKNQLIKITALGFEHEYVNIKLEANTQLDTTIILKSLFQETLTEVDIHDENYRTETGSIKIDAQKAHINPGPNSGIEGLLKIFTGDHNEISSQYKVRGGNFDENLVYVNDFEIHRPFLVRSGQQEGLSFVNADLVKDVNFSVGGFQAKYGDKLSSVLDVAYKRPQRFGGSVMLSLLGAQLHLEGASKNKKLTYLFGARQKSNQYLLQSQPTKGQYNPSFTDIQTLINYKINIKWETEIIANYARNRFNFIPIQSESAFGYFNNVYKLEMNFKGNEQDQFDTRFLGWSLTHKPNAATRLKLLASAFQTYEKETYDINGLYDLFAVESDLGSSSFSENKFHLGSGEIHDFARNYLNAQVYNIAHRGSHLATRHAIQWGVDATLVNINDRMLEWQRRDSAGFTQPVMERAIIMTRSVDVHNILDYMKYAAFIQDNILLGQAENMTLNIGMRATYTDFNKELLLSPRIQFSFKPKQLTNIVYRFSSGMYNQPPFYREMRDMSGHLNTQLKAQKAWNVAAGFDYNFKMMGNRPFKLTGELFYKNLWDLVPYEYDNVRIRYFANNNARGYAYGGEIRLFGDLVKNSESWISLGMMKTANQLFNENTQTWSEYIPRPTDQRFTIGMFFSDYLPQNKNFKVYLNLMYASGLPFSPPGKSLDANYRLRIPDYKRVDIGFSAILVDGSKRGKYDQTMFKSIENIWLSLEVFNLLNIQNTLSYQWIEDYNVNRIYGVPNRLTSRLFNVKLAVRF